MLQYKNWYQYFFHNKILFMFKYLAIITKNLNKKVTYFTILYLIKSFNEAICSINVNFVIYFRLIDKIIAECFFEILFRKKPQIIDHFIYEI